MANDLTIHRVSDNWYDVEFSDGTSLGVIHKDRQDAHWYYETSEFSFYDLDSLRMITEKMAELNAEGATE
jgi:hypothetical protein